MKVRRWLWIFMVMSMMLWHGRMVMAQGGSNVYEVEDKRMMCKQMITLMQKRQREVTMQYSGIYADMLQYKRDGYKGLYEDLSTWNAYVVGGVESMQIIYVDREDTSVQFRIRYRTTRQQERFVDRKVKRLTRQIRRRTARRRVQWAQDYLIRHMQYDERYHTAYDAFRRGKGNCMAYSYAFLKMMQVCQVPCLYVHSDKHAWNMVKLEGRWYYVDVTWEEAAGKKNRYFLRGEKDFLDHAAVRHGLPKKDKIAKRRYIYRSIRK